MPIANCSFCSNLGRAGTLIHEDERCAVLLHPDSAVAGHAMVVWKRHVENVADLNDEERAHFSRIHAAAERALLEVTGTDRAVLRNSNSKFEISSFAQRPHPAFGHLLPLPREKAACPTT